MDSGRLRLSSVEFFREEGFRSWSRALIIWGASATLTLPQLSIPTRRAYVKGIAEWPVVPFHEFGLTSLVECGALQEGFSFVVSRFNYSSASVTLTSPRLSVSTGGV